MRSRLPGVGRLSVLLVALLAGSSGLAAPGAPQPPATPSSGHRVRFLAWEGLVHDTLTDRVWQRCSVGQRWEAELGCVGLARKLWFDEAVLLESDGWRLPTLAELKTIVALERDAMADVEAFPDAPASWYWARDEQGQPAAWGISCAQGANDICDRGQARAVRLVRSGPYRPWPGK